MTDHTTWVFYFCHYPTGLAISIHGTGISNLLASPGICEKANIALPDCIAYLIPPQGESGAPGTHTVPQVGKSTTSRFQTFSGVNTSMEGGWLPIWGMPERSYASSRTPGGGCQAQGWHLHSGKQDKGFSFLCLGSQDKAIPESEAFLTAKHCELRPCQYGDSPSQAGVKLEPIFLTSSKTAEAASPDTLL